MTCYSRKFDQENGFDNNTHKTALFHEKKTVDTSSTFGAETPPGSEFLSLLRISELFQFI